MLTLAIANQKGGVAKTNLTGNLWAEFAARGQRIVLVDLDPQATLTSWLLGRTNAPGTAEILLGEEEAARVLIDVPAFGLALIAAVPDRLRIAERTLSAQVASERTLRKALRLPLQHSLMPAPSFSGLAARPVSMVRSHLVQQLFAGEPCRKCGCWYLIHDSQM